VVLDVRAGLRAEVGARGSGRIEVPRDERLEVEARVGAGLLVFFQDVRRRMTRQRVDKGLAVLVDALELDPLEEAGIQLDGRRRRGGAGCGRCAGDDPEQQAPDQNS
jgi:hypothetical protein